LNILLLDVETSPSTAYVWSLWKENIPLARLIDSSEVLCYTAKWLDDSHVYFDSIYNSPRKEMLVGIHKLLSDADAVIHYNGNNFDIPVLNKEFVLNGFGPPAPYKNIDLLRTVRSQFKFVSNKLDYVCERLGLGKKLDTDFKLWVDCMAMVPEAWKKMEEYNRHDVTLLEQLYNILRPWIKDHPNQSTYKEFSCCPNCGSINFQSRGYYYSTTRKYKRYRCKDCSTWFKEALSEKTQYTKMTGAG